MNEQEKKIAELQSAIESLVLENDELKARNAKLTALGNRSWETILDLSERLRAYENMGKVSRIESV